jgi:hypothetical protein
MEEWETQSLAIDKRDARKSLFQKTCQLILYIYKKSKTFLNFTRLPSTRNLLKADHLPFLHCTGKCECNFWTAQIIFGLRKLSSRGQTNSASFSTNGNNLYLLLGPFVQHVYHLAPVWLANFSEDKSKRMVPIFLLSLSLSLSLSSSLSLTLSLTHVLSLF